MYRIFGNRTLAVVLWILFLNCSGFSQNSRAILQQSLQAHGRGRLTDISATGTVTSSGQTQPINLYAKGNGSGRIENGAGSGRSVIVFDRGRSWAGADRDLRPLKDHTAQRRLTLFPFLDVIAELDQPQVEVAYRGLELVNGAPAHKVSVRAKDNDAAKRFLHRPLEEAVDFWIDERTGLIVRSERLRITEENMDFKIPSVLEFSDYRTVGGVAIPFRIVSTMGRPDIGIYRSTTVLTNVTINSGIPHTMFSPS